MGRTIERRAKRPPQRSDGVPPLWAHTGRPWEGNSGLGAMAAKWPLTGQTPKQRDRRQPPFSGRRGNTSSPFLPCLRGCYVRMQEIRCEHESGEGFNLFALQGSAQSFSRKKKRALFGGGKTGRIRCKVPAVAQPSLLRSATVGGGSRGPLSCGTRQVALAGKGRVSSIRGTPDPSCPFRPPRRGGGQRRPRGGSQPGPRGALQGPRASCLGLGLDLF